MRFSALLVRLAAFFKVRGYHLGIARSRRGAAMCLESRVEWTCPVARQS